MMYLKENNERYERIEKAEECLRELGISIRAWGDLILQIDDTEYNIPNYEFPRTIDEPFTREEE